MGEPKVIQLNFRYDGNNTFTFEVDPFISAEYVWQKCKTKSTQWSNVLTTKTNKITTSVNPITDIDDKFRCIVWIKGTVRYYSRSFQITKDLLNRFYKNSSQESSDQNNTNSNYKNNRNQYGYKQRKDNNHEPSVSDTDGMDGYAFERYCANVLRGNGFVDVKVTQGSGDFGIDILAKKDSITYAIQCKSYSGQVSNKAVQEAFSGKSFYDCMVAAVLTNSHFTDSAKETAKRNSVLLWDREYLDKMIKNTNSSQGANQNEYNNKNNERKGENTEERKNTNRNTSRESAPSYFKGCETWEQVRERYKNLMRAFHPDSGSGDTESSQAVNAQYEELKRKFGK